MNENEKDWWIFELWKNVIKEIEIYLKKKDRILVEEDMKERRKEYNKKNKRWKIGYRKGIVNKEMVEKDSMYE